MVRYRVANYGVLILKLYSLIMPIVLWACGCASMWFIMADTIKLDPGGIILWTGFLFNDRKCLNVVSCLTNVYFLILGKPGFLVKYIAGYKMLFSRNSEFSFEVVLRPLLQKEWRDRRDDFKKKVSRCVRKSQEML